MRHALKAATAAAILLLIAVTGASAAPSLAQEEPESIAFGIRPADTQAGPFFTYIATPGTVITDQALVENQADDPIDLKLYTADGLTSINGSVTFTQAGDRVRGVKDWLSINVDEVSLTGKDKRFVPFTVSVPPAAAIGDHVAGLVLEQPPEEVPGTVGARVINRVGVAIVVRVPGLGLFENLTLGPTCANRATGSNYFDIGVKNPGTILVTGTGTFTLVHTETKTPIFDREAILGSVVPGDSASLRLDAPFDIPGGTYTATTTLRTAPGSREVITSETITLPDEKVNGCTAPGAKGVGEEPEIFPFIPSFGGCPPWWWFLLVLLGELLAISWLVREYRRRLQDGRGASLRLFILMITVVVVIAILVFNNCFHWWWILIAVLEGLLGISLVTREYWRRLRESLEEAERLRAGGDEGGGGTPE